MLLAQTTITVTPQTQVRTEGRPVLTPGTPYTVTGTVLPATPEQVQLLREGARVFARYIMFVEGDPIVKTTSTANGTPADRVTWDGEELVVHSTLDFSMHLTGIPHKAYALVKVGGDE